MKRDYTLYCLYRCSENKGADQVPSYIAADLRLCFPIFLIAQLIYHEQEVQHILFLEVSCCFYAPNFEKVGGGAYWFRLVRMYVRMYVCIHVRDIVLKLHVWIPHGKIADAYFWFSLNYLPLSNYGPLTNKGMKLCKCRISKSIIARKLETCVS